MERLIDANALKALVVQTLEKIKDNPKMNLQEMHVISAMKMLCEMIDDMPTVNKWIDPKEKMPENDAEIFYKYNGDVTTDITEVSEGEFRLYHAYVPIAELEAWMPLIEPYEEEK